MTMVSVEDTKIKREEGNSKGEALNKYKSVRARQTLAGSTWDSNSLKVIHSTLLSFVAMRPPRGRSLAHDL